MDQMSIDNIPEEAEKLADGSTLITRGLEQVMHESMMPYAEYVILDRALPRVEDGLKPVQRRILYSMRELGITPDKPYKKSVVTVAECLGKYHPHGDTSVYDAMVRLAQPFNMNMPLVDGHGNFGSVDGDRAAAMRYTESRMTPLALELLKDIDYDTVKWSRNFDDTTKEPDMLPGRFPNLLVNGCSGIAVGLATNIPPHNLGEVIDGVVAFIDNKHITLDKMMKIITGPDFPTGGHVLSGDGLRQAYETGKGKIILQAKTHIEELPNDKHAIVFTELPYQVNKAQVLTEILKQREARKEELAGIAEIVDESDSEGMRGVIKIKKDYDPRVILDCLFKHSDLRISYNFNMVAIADGKPQQMGLLDIIAYYTNYQREVVFNRTKYQLNEAQARIHIVDGLVIAVTNIDEVIAVIKKSSNTTEAKANLRSRFALSDVQAQAILDIRLARLTRLEVDKLLQEKAELQALIAKYNRILSSKTELLEVLKEEINAIKKQFKLPRKSEILYDESQVVITNESDAKPIEKVVVTVSCDGSIKRVPTKNFGMSNKDATSRNGLWDLHTVAVSTETDRKVMLVSNYGTCFQTDVATLPDLKYHDKGAQLSELFKGEALAEDEVAIACFPLPLEGAPKGDLLMFTRGGLVKRTSWADMVLLKQVYSGYKGKDDDRIISAVTADCDSTVLCVTHEGMSINFALDEIPVYGRVSGGVKAINLNDGDYVVYAGQICADGEIVVVTDKCFVKRVISADMPISVRYRKGVKIVTCDKNNGNVLFVDYVTVPYDLALLDQATTLVLNTEEIPIEGRNTKGKTPKIRKKGSNLVKVVHYVVNAE